MLVRQKTGGRKEQQKRQPAKEKNKKSWTEQLATQLNPKEEAKELARTGKTVRSLCPTHFCGLNILRNQDLEFNNNQE
jgi:hypothetical protein